MGGKRNHKHNAINKVRSSKSKKKIRRVKNLMLPISFNLFIFPSFLLITVIQQLHVQTQADTKETTRIHKHTHTYTSNVVGYTNQKLKLNYNGYFSICTQRCGVKERQRESNRVRRQNKTARAGYIHIHICVYMYVHNVHM